MNINVTADINLNNLTKLEKEVGGDEFGLFLSQEVHRQYTPAMPAKTKAYSTNIRFAPWEYTHLESYSAEVYTVNKNYRKEINPFAMANYIEGFSGVAMPKIEKSAQNYVNARLK